MAAGLTEVSGLVGQGGFELRVRVYMAYHIDALDYWILILGIRIDVRRVTTGLLQSHILFQRTI